MSLKDCPGCHGRGVKVFKEIKLAKICERCEGRCMLDWIDFIIPKHTNMDYRTEYKSMENVQILIHELRNLCYSIDLDCRIDIQPMKIPDYNKRFIENNFGDWLK